LCLYFVFDYGDDCSPGAELVQLKQIPPFRARAGRLEGAGDASARSVGVLYEAL